MGAETVISFRMGTIMVLVSVVTAVVTGIASYAFMYGYTIKNEEVQEEAHRNMNRQHDEVIQLLKEYKMESLRYTDTEVGGLRSDWERELKNRR